MRLEIEDTNNISDMDRKILMLITEQQEEPITVKIGNKKFPKMRGKRFDTMLQILKYLEGGTITDILKVTDYSKASVGNSLSILLREKKIERSSSKPYTYYVKGENKELAFALKALKHRGK